MEVAEAMVEVEVATAGVEMVVEAEIIQTRTQIQIMAVNIMDIKRILIMT